MIALLLTALLQDPTAIRFSPPAKAKAEDVKKAAAGLEARCLAYGYDGITAKVGALKGVKGKADLVVELTCKEGFTAAMRDTIESLGAFSIAKTELAFAYWMEQAESDRYPAPRGGVAEISKTKAPAGAKWLPVVPLGSADESVLSPILIHDVPVLVQQDFSISFEGGAQKPRGDLQLKLTETGLKKWSTLPDKVKKAHAYLIYNGKTLASAKMDPLTEKAGVVTGGKYTQQVEAVCLMNPMPLDLQPVK